MDHEQDLRPHGWHATRELKRSFAASARHRRPPIGSSARARSVEVKHVVSVAFRTLGKPSDHLARLSRKESTSRSTASASPNARPRIPLRGCLIPPAMRAEGGRRGVLVFNGRAVWRHRGDGHLSFRGLRSLRKRRELACVRMGYWKFLMLGTSRVPVVLKIAYELTRSRDGLASSMTRTACCYAYRSTKVLSIVSPNDNSW